PLAGAESVLSQIPVLMQHRLTAYETQCSPRALAALSHIVTASFEANALYPALKASTGRHTDRERLSAALKGLRSAPVRTMTQLGAQASTPETLRQSRWFTLDAQFIGSCTFSVRLMRQPENRVKSFSFITCARRGFYHGLRAVFLSARPKP